MERVSWYILLLRCDKELKYINIVPMLTFASLGVKTGFPFATVAKGSNTPHVRYVIYRFLSSGPHSLIAITTDTRSKKYTHLRENPECEAAFWFEDVGVQFRVSGKAYVLPSGEHEGETETKADEEASKILNSIATGEEGNVEFWKEKREELWKKQSGHLRASFARPTPGKPLKEVDHAAKECFETLPAEGNTVGTPSCSTIPVNFRRKR